MEEVWKTIEEFKNYEVSNMGNVRNKDGKELKKYCNKYYYVTLYDANQDSFKVAVHRLVAKAFIPNPLYLEVVNHKDENKLNNCVDNLEWTSLLENVQYSSKKHPNDERYKQASKKVLQYSLEGDFIKEWDSLREASKTLHIHEGSISSCVRNKTKSSGGFQWKYYEVNFPIKIPAYNRGKKFRKIIQYDLFGNFIKVWNIAEDISKELNIATANIWNCCSGRTETSGKFIWRFYCENFPKKIETPFKKVCQFDLEGNLINTYDNILEASKNLGHYPGLIRSCCKGLRDKAYGFVWKYES